MHPILFQIGPLTIYSYGVLMMIAVVVCAFLLSRDAKRLNFSTELIFDMVFWVVLAGIVGARIFYIFLNLEYFIQGPSEIIKIQNGGLAWQGGLLGGIIAALVFIRLKKLPLARTADLAAPYVALGHGIGRIGCFFNGCCYGREVPWGIYFPAHLANLHPTQLYEAFSLIVIFLVLKKMQDGRLSSLGPVRPAGQIFVFYLILASSERFIIEFFRADHTFVFLNLSVFQWISLVVIGIAFYINTRLMGLHYRHYKGN